VHANGGTFVAFGRGSERLPIKGVSPSAERPRKASPLGFCQPCLSHTALMRTLTKHFEREVRRVRHVSAWIVLTGQADQECQLLDISKNGAKLVVGTPSQVPQHFELAFVQDSTQHRLCEVVWRRGKMIGVQFVQ
jgi:PilZ domain